MHLLCRCLFLGLSLAEQSVVISTIHQVISTTTCWIFASKRNNLSIDTMSSRTGQLPGVLPKAMTLVSHFKKKSVFTNGGFFMNDSLRAVFWKFRRCLWKGGDHSLSCSNGIIVQSFECTYTQMSIWWKILWPFKISVKVGTVDLTSFTQLWPHFNNLPCTWIVCFSQFKFKFD